MAIQPNPLIWGDFLRNIYTINGQAVEQADIVQNLCEGPLVFTDQGMQCNGAEVSTDLTPAPVLATTPFEILLSLMKTANQPFTIISTWLPSLNVNGDVTIAVPGLNFFSTNEGVLEPGTAVQHLFAIDAGGTTNQLSILGGLDAPNFGGNINVSDQPIALTQFAIVFDGANYTIGFNGRAFSPSEFVPETNFIPHTSTLLGFGFNSTGSASPLLNSMGFVQFVAIYNQALDAASASTPGNQPGNPTSANGPPSVLPIAPPTPTGNVPCCSTTAPLCPIPSS
jgi:hypothetical protein